jgi:hypothetical protein
MNNDSRPNPFYFQRLHYDTESNCSSSRCEHITLPGWLTMGSISYEATQ